MLCHECLLSHLNGQLEMMQSRFAGPRVRTEIIRFHLKQHKEPPLWLSWFKGGLRENTQW